MNSSSREVAGSLPGDFAGRVGVGQVCRTALGGYALFGPYRKPLASETSKTIKGFVIGVLVGLYVGLAMFAIGWASGQ